MLTYIRRRLWMPLLTAVLALECLGFGPPVLVDGIQQAARLYPYQISEIRQAHRAPAVTAQAALLADVDTNQVLLAVNPDLRLPMASTTKIMTALLALERGQLDQEITVPAAALAVGGSSMLLASGETLTLHDLLYGLLLPSGNDAAVTIATALAGSQAAFVDLMNARAAALGMRNTHFANVHGLDEADHYSSVQDLYVLTRAALRYPLFRQIVATAQATVAGHALTNRNELLTTVAGADGVKTGTTDEAGECLVGTVTRGGHQVMLIVLGSRARYADANLLLDHYYAYWHWLELSPPGDAQDRARDATGEWRFLLPAAPAAAFVAQWERPWLQAVTTLDPAAAAAPGSAAGTIYYAIGSRQVATQALVWGRY